MVSGYVHHPGIQPGALRVIAIKVVPYFYKYLLQGIVAGLFVLKDIIYNTKQSRAVVIVQVLERLLAFAAKAGVEELLGVFFRLVQKRGLLLSNISSVC
jgi:hypothetical protein